MDFEIQGIAPVIFSVFATRLYYLSYLVTSTLFSFLIIYRTDWNNRIQTNLEPNLGINLQTSSSLSAKPETRLSTRSSPFEDTLSTGVAEGEGKEEESDQKLTGDVLLFEKTAPAPTPSPTATNLALDNLPPKPPLENITQSKAGITALLFSPAKKAEPFDLEDLRQLISHDESFVWVDITNHTEGDLRNLALDLGLHSLGLKVALEGWQRPRFDTFRSRQQYLITATIAHLNPATRQVLAAELDLFVGNNFLISVHKTALPFAKRLAERAKESPELVKLDAAFMLYLILDELLEYYEELSDHLEVETAKMEINALKDTTDSFLEDLVQLKQYIFALTRLVDQHRKVFAGLVKPDNSLTSDEEVSPYFQDLETHFERLIDTLQPAKDAVNGAFDIYVSHMSHKTNQIIKTLTIFRHSCFP